MYAPYLTSRLQVPVQDMFVLLQQIHLFYLFALFENKTKEYSAKSQNIMNENPTKSPRAPPNSDTNDTQGYIITSVLRLTFLLASMIERCVEFVE